MLLRWVLLIMLKLFILFLNDCIVNTLSATCKNKGPAFRFILSEYHEEASGICWPSWAHISIIIAVL